MNTAICTKFAKIAGNFVKLNLLIFLIQHAVIILHEMAHYVVGLAFGIKAFTVRFGDGATTFTKVIFGTRFTQGLFPTSGSTIWSRQEFINLGAFKRIIIFLSGPIFSLMIFAVILNISYKERLISSFISAFYGGCAFAGNHGLGRQVLSLFIFAIFLDFIKHMLPLPAGYPFKTDTDCLQALKELFGISPYKRKNEKNNN